MKGASRSFGFCAPPVARVGGPPRLGHHDRLDPTGQELRDDRPQVRPVLLRCEPARGLAGIDVAVVGPVHHRDNPWTALRDRVQPLQRLVRPLAADAKVDDSDVGSTRPQRPLDEGRKRLVGPHAGPLSLRDRVPQGHDRRGRSLPWRSLSIRRGNQGHEQGQQTGRRESVHRRTSWGGSSFPRIYHPIGATASVALPDLCPGNECGTIGPWKILKGGPMPILATLPARIACLMLIRRVFSREGEDMTP